MYTIDRLSSKLSEQFREKDGPSTKRVEGGEGVHFLTQCMNNVLQWSTANVTTNWL